MDLTLYISTPPRPSWELPSRLGESPADMGTPWAELLHARRGWAESYQSKELELSCKAGSRYTLVMGLEDVHWDKEDRIEREMRNGSQMSGSPVCLDTDPPLYQAPRPCHLAQVHSLVLQRHRQWLQERQSWT